MTNTFIRSYLLLCIGVAMQAAAATTRPSTPAGPTGGQVYTIPANEQANGPGIEKIEGPSLDANKPLKASITVDTGKVISHISPMIYGACLEDLNHEVYGGLYAQMIFGESFEEGPEAGLPSGWTVWPTLNRRPMFTGMWAMEDGTLWLTAYRDYSLVRDDVTIRDGVVACELRQDKYDPDRWLSVGVRVDPKNYRVGYRLRFSGAAGELSLWRNTTRLTGAHVDCGLDQWLAVKLKIDGGNISVSVVGQEKPVFTCVDPSPLPAGGISCDADACRGLFRNLSVSAGDSHWNADFRTEHPHGTVSCWWDPILEGDGEFKWDADHPFNTERSQKITLRSATGVAGVVNRGLGRWGLSLDAGRNYAGRLYLRGQTAGPVTVALQNADGSATYASQSIGAITEEWKRYDISLTSSHTDRNARLAIWLDHPGTIWVDQVVLMPTGDGLFKGQPVRADLANLLVDSHVTAIRYGGDNSGALGFPWKNQIGDPDARPQYNCPWYAFDSRGWGIVEFIAFCRAAGIEPIPCISHRETAADAADLVSFCNEPADGQWGRIRAGMGYPQPFNLRWIQYGNGFCGADKTAALADAIHHVDANVTILSGSIGHMPSVLPKPATFKEWGQLLNGKISGYAVFPYVGGWGDGKQWEQMIQQIRASSGDIKVYCQEVNGGIHNLLRGLADAQFNSICEQHADDLAAVTYCGLVEADAFPDNGWEQGRIFFNNHACWLQPAGWVGKMASQSSLPIGVACETNVLTITGQAYGHPQHVLLKDVPLLSVTAARDEANSRFTLKVVNIANVPITADVELKGIEAIVGPVDVSVLAGHDLKATNTADDEQKLHPEHQQIKLTPRFNYTFAPYSFTVFGPFPIRHGTSPAIPADSPPGKQSRLIDVLQNGAAGDGKTKDTAAVQSAIDRAAAAGGGTVVFPPGDYLIGGIQLRSHVTLDLQGGATILGSTTLRDYALNAPPIPSARPEFEYPRYALIHAEHVDDVAIVGTGTINGQGGCKEFSEWRHLKGHEKADRLAIRPYLLGFVHCRNVTVRGVTLRDSAYWVEDYLDCDGVRVSGLTVTSHANGNNDGLDIDGSRNVRVSDCNIDTSDDALCMKASYCDCQNVVISNCIVKSGCNGIKCGTASIGGFKNIVIGNCVVRDTELAGVALEIVDGGTLDGIVVHGICMSNVGMPLFLRLGNRGRQYIEMTSPAPIGQFRNVTISDIVATTRLPNSHAEFGLTPLAPSITGMPGHRLEHLTVTNLRVTYRAGCPREQVVASVPENERGYPEIGQFGPLPAYGLYCRHVAGMTLHNLDFTHDQPDARRALVCDDVKEMVLDPATPGSD